MLRVVPVMEACSGLAKKSMAFAISAGEINLPIGCLASRATLAAFASSDKSRSFLIQGVSVVAGFTA